MRGSIIGLTKQIVKLENYVSHLGNYLRLETLPSTTSNGHPWISPTLRFGALATSLESIPRILRKWRCLASE
jgi:hypothetical protein